MKTTLLAGAAALLVAGAASAAPAIAVHGQAPTVPFISHSPQSVLYVNGTDASGVGIVSQRFESAFNIYDSSGADDFTVPAGKTWTITEVDAPGAYFNGAGLAASENVVIWTNRSVKGLPGHRVATIKNVKGADDGLGNFTITLPTPVVLTAGVYWLEVQANLAFSAGGEWGWETTATSSGQPSPAAWRNPKGGFGSPCPRFANMQNCIGQSGEGPDFIFTLKGSSN